MFILHVEHTLLVSFQYEGDKHDIQADPVKYGAATGHTHICDVLLYTWPAYWHVVIPTHAWALLLNIVPFGHPLMHVIVFASYTGVGLTHWEHVLEFASTKGALYGQLVIL